jgi:hypothetical protein
VTVPVDKIAQKLDVARRDLLDLGLRNPLLNYRLTGRRGVSIVDERSREVFRLVVAEQKTMAFLPAQDDLEPSQGRLLAQPDEVDSNRGGRDG